MPKASQTMEEGIILSWHKNEGEPVRKGEVLLEIETDKAIFEVEAPDSGVLRKILCPSGSTVPVLAPVAILAGASEDISLQLAEALSELGAGRLGGASPAKSQVVTNAGPAELINAADPAHGRPAEPDIPLVPDGRIKASPLARRLAKARGVDLARVWPGSGPGGRILAADLDRKVLLPVAASEPVRRALSGMRAAIARNLVASKQNIPHFYVRLTIDAEPLLTFHLAEKARYSCTITDVITLACAKVIVEFPAFRSRIVGEDLTEYAGANIGLAVGVEDGLRVPVLVSVERMTLRLVAEQTRRIIEAAKRGKVEAMGQGVFTISNLGMYGVEEFAAIINPPESAILAVGAIRETAIVKDGALRAGRVMTMTLSADHRIIDGLLAARFLRGLKEILEAPEALGR